MNNKLRRLRKEIHRRVDNIRASSTKMSTSLSDNERYPDFCNKASLDSKIFKYFRLHPVYNRILESISKTHAMHYYEIVMKEPDFLKNVEEFKRNDIWGCPLLYDFPKIGMMALSTLRYIRIMYELKKVIDLHQGLDICEIGVGYGGQCRILDSYLKPSTYTLIDLKPALRLAQRYLDHFALHATVSYRTMNELEARRCDVVISNYAFSELPRSIQEVYFDKVIARSRKGYMIMNEINPISFNSYKKEELLALIPNSRILEEKPLTHPNNYIIIWD